MSDAAAIDKPSSATLPGQHEAIAELGLLALRERDIDLLLQHAVVVLSKLLDVEYSGILSLLPDGEEFLLRAAVGLSPELIGTATVSSLGGTQAGYTLRHTESVVVPDFAAETRFSSPALLDGSPVVSGMSVVIPGDREHPYGVLSVHTSHRRTFSAEDVSALRSVAHLVAGSVLRCEHEKALAAAESKYRNLVERLPLTTYIDALDDTFSSLFASPQIEDLLGYTPAEWAELPDLFFEVLHPDDRDRVLDEHARLRTSGEELRTEYRMIARDGRVVWVQDQGTVVEGEPGSPRQLEGVLLDVTEQKRLEDQLRQAQKMEAVGQLAGGIAHDFNNLLMAIIGYGDFVLARLGPDDPLRPDVEEITAAGNRAADLTRQLLAFSRKQVLQPKILDLNAVVREMERMLQRLIGEHLELITALEPDLGRTQADPGQIEQVIVNLAANARDAMPEGGVLAVETANVELDEAAAHRHLAEIAPGSYVVLTVSDTGTGMDPETLRHLFEPFFTTKGTAGTGLGLATVYGIVKQSGGFVWVYSEPGGGTIFRIYLPRLGRQSGDLDAEGPPTPISAPPVGTETILLVEDEEQVRSLIARDLRERGFTVLVASDYEHALELFDVHKDDVDLLLTDVVMPGGSGLDLAEEIRRRRPEIRALSMSGYAGSVLSRHVFPGAAIQKPFGAAVLAKRIREVLDDC